MTKAKQSARDEAIATLRETLKPGMTVYTVLRGVSRSGMSRNIDLYVMENNAPRWISRYAATATGFQFDEKHDCLKIGGCGMDMGFHAVYSLSRVLYPNGFGLPCKKCSRVPSKKDSVDSRAPQCNRGHEFCGRNGDTTGWDNDGGYAIGQRWM